MLRGLELKTEALGIGYELARSTLRSKGSPVAERHVKLSSHAALRSVDYEPKGEREH